MSSLIEDYGLIGDGQTAALVNRDGSVDWLCWPRFDSDACFAALLGDERHGSWSFAPRAKVTGRSRRYEEDTLVLQTDAEVEGGAYRITDFMPIRDGDLSSLVRIVEGLSGTAALDMVLNLRFTSHHRERPGSAFAQATFWLWSALLHSRLPAKPIPASPCGRTTP